VNKVLSPQFSSKEIIDFKLIARDLGGLAATATVSIIFPEVFIKIGYFCVKNFLTTLTVM
jgi:hypothetical protein